MTRPTRTNRRPPASTPSPQLSPPIKEEREQEAPSPLAALLGHLAFATVIAIVIARGLMLESIRDVGDFAGFNATRSPGAATSIVLDWLSFVPVLLILARRIFDASRRIRFAWSQVFLAALAIWCLASVAWADDKFLALISAARIAGGAALFWSTSQLVRRHDHLRVIVGVVIGLLLVNIVQGIYYQNVDLPDLRRYWESTREQFFASRGWAPGDYMAQRFDMKILAGEMLNFSMSANVLGAVVVSAALVAFAAGMQRLEDTDDRGWAGAILITAIGSLYVLLYSGGSTATTLLQRLKDGSKASWTALAIGLILLGGWRVTREWLGQKRRLTFGVAVATLAIAICGVIAFDISRGGLPSASLNFRWRYWIGAWRLFQEHPFLGVGWGNFGDAYLRHRLPQAAEEIQDPHSFPVRWATEVGFVGLMLGLAWLVAWAWQVCSPSPGTPGEGRGEGLELGQPSAAQALTLTLSQRTGRGDQIAGRGGRMPITRVLIALLLAFTLIAACTLDVTGDASYAILEFFRRAVHVGLIALAVGVVCLGKRESPDEPYFVDDRPAPWLVAGVFVGVVMMLVQSTIDIALFQPGPWVMVVVMMGSLVGITRFRSSRGATPSVVVVGEQKTEPAINVQRRRCIAAIAITVFAWIAAAVVVTRVVIAEQYASLAEDALARKDAHRASILAASANRITPVSNFDYASKEALARDTEARQLNGKTQDGLTPRSLFDRTIAAAPNHAMNWLTRARWLSNPQNVAPADVQQSVDDFGRAIALNPTDVDLRIEYADLLQRFGHQLSAADQLEKALALDDQLDPKEPERLDLRSPGKREELRRRIGSLQAANVSPSPP